MDNVPQALRRWPGHTGSWGKWNNERGALNFMSPEVIVKAAATVREGRIVQCARPILLHDPDNTDFILSTHEMLYARKTGHEKDVTIYGDRIGVRIHNMSTTHVDAFSHLAFKGYTYNGRNADDVVTMEKAAVMNDVTDVMGIVTRGIFIDVARARGVDGLRPGEYVTPEDIEPHLSRFQPGDAAILRTGVTNVTGLDKNDAHGQYNLHHSIAGIHADCVELLAERQISLLASDSPSDAYPSPIEPLCESPVHCLCLVFHGIPLVHNMDLEELGKVCSELGRSEMMFVVSALNFPKATGSPCTPLAVL